MPAHSFDPQISVYASFHPVVVLVRRLSFPLVIVASRLSFPLAVVVPCLVFHFFLGVWMLVQLDNRATRFMLRSCI